MIIFNIILAATIFIAAIAWLFSKLFFGETAKALGRLNSARMFAEQKQVELDTKSKRVEEGCRELIKEAQKKAEEVKNKAIQDSENVAKEIIAKSRKQAEEIVQKANESKEKMRQSIEKEVNLKVIDFCAQAVEQVLKGALAARHCEVVVQDFLKELESTDDKYLKDVNKLEIISSHDISEALQEQIKEAVVKKTKTEVSVTKSLDPSLICGVVLKFGTMVLDGSILTKVKAAADNLKKKEEKA